MDESPDLSLQITELLQEWSDGKDEILDEFIPVIYKELRRLAHRYIARERKNHTLQTTALINEAYLKLVSQKNKRFESRNDFIALSSTIMRHILVDYARNRNRERRGGRMEHIPLEDAILLKMDGKIVDVLELDEVLKRLARLSKRQAKIVELRFFCDLTIEETGEILGIAERTVTNDWRIAKAWLRQEFSR